MSKFLLLTKVAFLSGFNVNRKKKNQKSSLSAFILLMLVFMLLSILYSFALFMNDDIENKGITITKEEALMAICCIGSLLTLVLGMFQMQTVFFKTKDYEALESMPIKKSTIVSSKIAAIYFTNLCEDAALVIPAIIFYIALTKNFLVAGLAFIAIFFLSFLPILISTFIGVVSATVTAKIKHSNIIGLIVNTLFMLVFFGGYLFIIYSNKTQVANAAAKIFIFDWLLKAFNGDYIYYLWFLLTNIGAAILSVLIVVPLYRPVNSWMNSNNDHVDYEKIKGKFENETSLNKILLKKEWNMIYRKPNYLINSSIGSLFFLIIGILFIFGYQIFINDEVDHSTEEIITKVFTFMIPLLGIMMNSIACTTSTSISFERRTGYELLRSYPIDPIDIIKAKVKISLIIEVVLNLFVSTVLTVLFIIKGNTEPALYIMIYLFPQLAAINLAFIGMLCGLRWPKLDFETDQQVIKNSAAANFPVLFCMLPSFIVMSIGMVFVIAATKYPIMLYLSLAIITIIYLIQIIIFSMLLGRKGRKLFDNIINK